MFLKNSVLSYALLYSNEPLFVLTAVVSLQDCEGSAGGSDVPSPSTSVEPCSPLSQVDASTVRSTKRKNDSETQSLLEQRTATLERMAQRLEAPAPDDCAGFGSVVAQYLRQMPLLKRAKCEAQIMELIVSHLDE